MDRLQLTAAGMRMLVGKMPAKAVAAMYGAAAGADEQGSVVIFVNESGYCRGRTVGYRIMFVARHLIQFCCQRHDLLQ